MPCILISLHWPTVIHDYLKDKAHGGPFETPFQHACEVEASYSLALFPEFMQMELVGGHQAGGLPAARVTWTRAARSTTPRSRGTSMSGWVASRCWSIPEGVIGRPTLADAEKAKPGLEALLDYMCKLIDDIMTRFPAGQLPPVDKVTMRDPEEIEALLKGPLNGGKHLYTVAYPP